MRNLLLSCVASFWPLLAQSVCDGEYDGTPPTGTAPIPSLDAYNAALKDLDVKAVMDDIIGSLTDSQACWPADTFHGVSSYGPLFVRLAWHCSGSFRSTDGAGGCSGGRQRFDPEASWADNVNLDKARGLLAPIKKKHGDALSWGDLFILAGTASMQHMGMHIDSVCAGRVDDADGKKSAPLGPGAEQPPCPVQGDCQEPLGTSTVGLIYVNPEGYMGVPDPVHSASQIRDIFGRMGMNDTETVALIGGGHAFGKSHGACLKGAGLPPDQDPANPWAGNCGTGKGNDTYSSGIEGPWTSNPLQWDNEYYQQLLDANYTVSKGPGGKYQWTNEANKNMMMTTDVALVHDDKYRVIVQQYASDLHALTVQFAAAWKKLTESGGQWAANKKCIEYN